MAHEENDSTAVERRVFRVLDGIQQVLLGLIVIGGGVFVFGYRSDNAVLAGYSWKYLVAVVGPFLLLAVCCGWLRVESTTAHSRLKPIHTLIPRSWLPFAALVLIGSGVVLAVLAPDARVAVAVLILAWGIAMTSWARHSRSPQLLLLSSGPVLVAAMMFAFELPTHFLQPDTVEWGTPESFAYADFPGQPPFIGPGGRLHGNLDTRLQAPEYPDGARLVTNNIGLRNRCDFTSEPDSGTLRILSLGDSFATGFCADQDHFFGSLLVPMVGSDSTGHSRCEVLNAEVSDPAYGLRYLQQYGLDLAPDIVLYGLCGNDVMQSAWFAGPGRRFELRDDLLLANPDYGGDPMTFFERYDDFTYSRERLPGTGGQGFAPLTGVINTLAGFRLFSGLLGTNAQRSTPVVTQGYGEGYQPDTERLRMLDGGANAGFYLQPASPIISEMYEVFFDLLQTMQRSAEQSGARFILVLFPQRHQVHPADWEVMCRYWNLDPADFDLEAPNRTIMDFCNDHRIECVDLLGSFRAAAGDGSLYLSAGDVHFNRRGHVVAATAVAGYLNRAKP